MPKLDNPRSEDVDLNEIAKDIIPRVGKEKRKAEESQGNEDGEVMVKEKPAKIEKELRAASCAANFGSESATKPTARTEKNVTAWA